ncbi:hypothetical protein ABPG72_015760 [Tetrahymena utriculariae]
MLCSKHFNKSTHFCISDCCLFQRRKCQQCLSEDSHRLQGSNSFSSSSFFDENLVLNSSRISHSSSGQTQKEHQLIDYDQIKQRLKETVHSIKQELNQVNDNQSAYQKIHQIFLIIKKKIIKQLDQAQQHIIHSLSYFYSNIHKSDLSNKINILYDQLHNQPQNNKQQFFKNNKNNNEFLSFSNKYLDEFIADLLLQAFQKKQNNPFSPLEIENCKLKEIFKKLKELTCVAENFSIQSIGFIFEEKAIPEIDFNSKGQQQIQLQNKYKTNIMHQHSMQVKCVQNLGNQFIVSCGFDKKIKISTTLKNESNSLVQDIQLKHNIVCTDMMDSNFICGNEIGEGTLFDQNKGSFKKVSEFKLHDSLVYTIKFLTKNKIISGSINELTLFDIFKNQKLQNIKFNNSITTDICKLSDTTFLVGDSTGSISFYKEINSQKMKISLVKAFQLHKRPIVKIEILKSQPKKIISGSRDQNIIIFNLITSQVERQIILQNPLVTMCLLSPFEIVSSDSSTIYFHNILTGELVYKIIPQTKSISCVDSNSITKTIYLGQGKSVCSIQFS